ARAAVASERSVAVVEPQTRLTGRRPRDEDIDEAIVVVIADGDRRSAGESEATVGDREMPASLVVIERGRTLFADDENVHPPVAIEIGERRVARRATGAGRESHRLRHVRERAVEVIAIDDECRTADQHEIEIAVVIEIREERFASAGEIRDGGL